MQLDTLAKSFPAFKLGPLSLELEQGCILGFAGPNGAGKTTTLKMIMGLIRPESGTIKIRGQRVDRQNGLWKNEIGYLAQDHVFYEGWKGSKILEFHARFRPNWCMSRAETIAKRLDLDLDKPARLLSRGNRIKLALVTIMAYQPRLLLLDEPTSGLDPVTRNEVLEMLLEYASAGEHSVLFSTHIISDMAKIADRVTFLKNGQIIGDGSPFDITEGWRKIRFRFPFEKMDLAGVVSHKSDGNMHLVITSEHQKTMAQLKEAGAFIQDIHRTSLEEASVFILKGEMPCSN